MPKKRGGKKHPPTMRVRVRSKNPQIGRKLSDTEGETMLADAEDFPLGPAVLSPPVRVSTLMDEDATEIVNGPPPIPRQDIVVRSVERSSVPIERTSGVVPRQRVGMLGTKGAGALAAKVRVQRTEKEMVPTTIPELRILSAHLDPHQIESLDAALTGRAEQRDLSSARTSPKRALERLIHTPSYLELLAPQRARVLGAISKATHDIESISAAVGLLETRIAKDLDGRDRSRLLDVFELATPSQRRQLATLAGREIHGRSALFDRDFEDTSLLEHLHGIASAKRIPNALAGIGVKKHAVMSMVLTTLAKPVIMPLEDGGDGVLGMFEFGLADSSPAELTRLWRCLVTGDMQAPLPGDGTLDLAELIRSQPGLHIASSNSALRVGLEQLAEFAHPRAGPKRTAFIMPGGESLDADVTARALGYLYGVGFTVVASAVVAIRQLESASERPERVPPVFVTVLHDNGERLFVFDRIKGSQVYVRAPHGGSTKPTGGRRLDPMRMIHDPQRGIDVIDREEFEKNIGVALIPRT